MILLIMKLMLSGFPSRSKSVEGGEDDVVDGGDDDVDGDDDVVDGDDDDVDGPFTYCSVDAVDGLYMSCHHLKRSRGTTIGKQCKYWLLIV